MGTTKVTPTLDTCFRRSSRNRELQGGVEPSEWMFEWCSEACRFATSCTVRLEGAGDKDLPMGSPASLRLTDGLVFA